MRFTNKFKATSLIALALVLGACSGGELPSSTSNSISSSSNSNTSSSSSSSSTTSSSISSSTIPSYLITFVNYDDSVLYTTNVIQGQTAVYVGATPTRPATSDFTYVFTGWDRTLTNITSAFTTKAQFTENLNYIPITNAQELSNIRNNLSGNYRLMNDIDLESVEWQPIGSAISPFTGTLDGNRFSISNLTITQTQEYVGLFAFSEGGISSLKLINIQINPHVSAPSSFPIITKYIGSLVAYNKGKINDIKLLSGSILLNCGLCSSFVGGIIGFHFNNNLAYLLNNAEINNSSYIGVVGGLVGSIEESSITNSINTGQIKGSRRGVGGLVGQGDKSTINHSLNKGLVSGNGFTEAVGGIVGHSISSIEIINSANEGIISGTNAVGGLVGYGVATIESSINTGKLSITSQYCGGLIGYSLSTLLSENSINFGDIISTSFSYVYITTIGGITANLPPSYESIQTFYFASINSNGIEVSGVDFGTKITDTSIFNPAFFTTTLGWDTEVWDFTGLDIANGVYPTLKNMPVVEA